MNISPIFGVISCPIILDAPHMFKITRKQKKKKARIVQKKD